MMNCKDAQQAILEDAPAKLRDEVREHIARCTECSRMQDAMASFRQIEWTDEPPAAVDDTIRAAAAARCPKPLRPAWFNLRLPRPALALAAAAVLVGALFMATVLLEPIAEQPHTVAGTWEDTEFQEELTDTNMMLESWAYTVGVNGNADEEWTDTDWNDTRVQDEIIELQANIILQES